MNRQLLGAVAVVALLAAGGVYAATSLSSPGPANETTPDTTTTTLPATTTTATTTTTDTSPGNGTDAMPATPNATLTKPASSDLVLRPKVDQVIGGETNLPAGTDLAVRMRSTGSSPFIKSRQVEVRADGSYVAAFDMADVPSGAEFQVAVRYNGSALAEATGMVRAENPEASLDYEGDVLLLDSASGQVVRGETTLPPGSEVAIRLRSSDSEQPFLKSQAMAVRQNGTFAATFDMADVAPGTEFDVIVYHLGERITTAPGNVTATN